MRLRSTPTRDQKRRDHVFVIRTWSVAGEQMNQWRGSAEHVRSGQRFFFTRYADLVDFLDRFIGDGGGVDTA